MSREGNKITFTAQKFLPADSVPFDSWTHHTRVMSSTPFHKHTAFLCSGLIDPGKCQIPTRRCLSTPRGGVESLSEDLTAVASGCSPLCFLVLVSPTRPCSRQVNPRSPQGASRHQIPGIGEMMKESEKSKRSGTCTTHLSAMRILRNCCPNRQARRGPTWPPSTTGSAMAPTHRSMLSGVP